MGNKNAIINGENASHAAGPIHMVIKTAKRAITALSSSLKNALTSTLMLYSSSFRIRNTRCNYVQIS